jgi:hypothetical protein
MSSNLKALWTKCRIQANEAVNALSAEGAVDAMAAVGGQSGIRHQLILRGTRREFAMKKARPINVTGSVHPVHGF